MCVCLSRSSPPPTHTKQQVHANTPPHEPNGPITYLGDVNGHVEVVVDEAFVLVRVQQLQQRRGGVPSGGGGGGGVIETSDGLGKAIDWLIDRLISSPVPPQLVHLVDQDQGVGGAHLRFIFGCFVLIARD